MEGPTEEARGGSGMRRVLGLAGVRRMLIFCAALGVGVWALLLIQWALVATFVVAVVEGAAPDLRLLGGALVAWLARAGLVALRELLAARTSTRVRRDARAGLVRVLLARGPDAVLGERAGELVTTATEGVAKLDGVVGRFLPGTATAVVVPGWSR